MNWIVVLGFLAWVLAGFILGRMIQWSGRRAIASYALARDGGLMCPSCTQRFTPELPHRWTKVSKCLNGLEYCAKCKREGKCGC